MNRKQTLRYLMNKEHATARVKRLREVGLERAKIRSQIEMAEMWLRNNIPARDLAYGSAALEAMLATMEPS